MKTAVEWFVEQMSTDLKMQLGYELIEQAISMEKHQIVNAWDNGFANGHDLGKYNDDCNPEDAEQYYNEEYGNETTQKLE